MREVIKKIPSQEFLITFEYETIKGYRREQQRTLTTYDEESAKAIFNKWIKKCRTMLNAKILSIDGFQNKGQTSNE